MEEESWDWSGLIIARPRNVEEMLLAIGMKEENERTEIIMTTELVADICVRLVRIEDWRNTNGQSETEG